MILGQVVVAQKAAVDAGSVDEAGDGLVRVEVGHASHSAHWPQLMPGTRVFP